MTGRNHSQLTCHCGAVELRIKLADGLATMRRCTCSYCRRRGAIAASVRVGDLTVVRGEDALRLYQFGTGVAEHYFCSVCGIYTHHKRRSNPDEFGVNVGALTGVDPSTLGDIPWADGINHPSDQKG